VEGEGGNGTGSSSKSSPSVPVYVMLPLDTIQVHHHGDGTSESCVQSDENVDRWLVTLKEAGVRVRFCCCWQYELHHHAWLHRQPAYLINV
jgi:hypothetical protein